MECVKYTKITIIARLFDLFCQQLILVPIKSLTSNKYRVKDSFVFVEEIVEQDSGFFWGGSLDVDSLLTNIPLEETIHI